MSSEQGVGGSSPSAGTNLFMQIFFIVIAIIIILFGFTAFTGAPYVPSLKSEIEKAFTKLYPLGRSDFLIDLGAGDGVVQKVASSLGAKSLGVELNPALFLIAKFRLRHHKNAKVIMKNFYNYNFPKETTIIYIFGDGRDIEKIFEKVEKESKRLKKSLKVISFGFEAKRYKKLKTLGAYHLYEIK